MKAPSNFLVMGLTPDNRVVPLFKGTSEECAQVMKDLCKDYGWQPHQLWFRRGPR